VIGRVTWSSLFVALAVSHLAGDYLLQTEWQARNKNGGLGADPLARRALLQHGANYLLACIPVLIWVTAEIGLAALALIPVIVIPHLVLDDGRLLRAYVKRVKHAGADNGGVLVAVDQSFHAVALLLAALLFAG
jgi:hypothetical protein